MEDDEEPACEERDTKTFEDVLKGMQGEKDRKREKERGGGGGEGGVWRQGKKGPVRMSM